MAALLLRDELAEGLGGIPAALANPDGGDAAPWFGVLPELPL